MHASVMVVETISKKKKEGRTLKSAMSIVEEGIIEMVSASRCNLTLWLQGIIEMVSASRCNLTLWLQPPRVLKRLSW